MRYFYLSWSLVWLACSYFVFELSSYSIDVMSQTYWKGFGMYFRFPWEHIKEGEMFPHSFRLITDVLGCDEQQQSLGRSNDA